MENDIQDLEWEIPPNKITISRFDDSEQIPKGIKKVLINRDEDYKLRLTLFHDDDEFKEKIEEAIDKEKSSNNFFEFSGLDENSRQYIFKNCLITKSESSFNPSFKQKFELFISEVYMTTDFKKEKSYLTEWYLNGPEIYVFNKITKRIKSKGVREHLFSKNDQRFDKNGKFQVSYSTDFIKVDYSDFQFLITRVPHEYGPKWSANIGIEYRKEWGRIPEENERKIVSELCSFILGRQLLLIGNTVYGHDWNIINEYFCNPWGESPRSICNISKNDRSPVRIRMCSNDAESLIYQLLPQYFKLRSDLGLCEALWFYWISRYTTIGMNLPILWSAIEVLMKKWLKGRKSKSHGVYIKKSEFETLLKSELDFIEKKLVGIPHKDAIIANIKRSNEMSLTDKIPVFFEELPLNIDKAKWKTIAYERHYFAHGGLDFDDINWKSIIGKTDALETIFHKVMLKLLGYSGKYIDYSVEEWAEKELV
jgi:hypothetical protein